MIKNVFKPKLILKFVFFYSSCFSGSANVLIRQDDMSLATTKVSKYIYNTKILFSLNEI